MTLAEHRTPTPCTASPGYLRRSYEVVYDFLAVRDELVASDAIVCFGSRDPVVPRRAAALYHAGLAPVVMTTGGVPLRGDRSEADVFADELVALGVPAERVVVERDSAHTGENVVLGMELLRRRCGPIASVISVAWPFAVRRCRATFARHDPALVVRSTPASVDARRQPLTAGTARWAVEQLERLSHYSAVGEIAPEPVPGDVDAAAAELRRVLSLSSS